mgnify:CR=1 FL=1
MDPLAPEYPWYTPYQFAGNMPIWAVDLDGLEEKIVITVAYSSIAEPTLKVESEFTINVPPILRKYATGTLKLDYLTVYEGNVIGEGDSKAVQGQLEGNLLTGQQLVFRSLDITTLSYRNNDGEIVWELEDVEENETIQNRFKTGIAPLPGRGRAISTFKNLYGLWKAGNYSRMLNRSKLLKNLEKNFTDISGLPKGNLGNIHKVAKLTVQKAKDKLESLKGDLSTLKKAYGKSKYRVEKLQKDIKSAKSYLERSQSALEKIENHPMFKVYEQLKDAIK